MRLFGLVWFPSLLQVDFSRSILQHFKKKKASQQPPLKHVFHPGKEHPLSLGEGVGERSWFKSGLSGMLWERLPAPSWVLPSERTAQCYPSSKKSLGEEGVTLPPRFKAVLMQLRHLVLQGLKQTKSNSVLGGCSGTNNIRASWAPPCQLSKGNGCGFSELRVGLSKPHHPKGPRTCMALNLAMWC